MKIDPDKVYLYGMDAEVEETPEGPVAPFDTYRRLACEALARVELSLPGTGKILLKPNATVLYPPERRIITHPGFLAGLLDELSQRGIPRQRLVVAEGQSGEYPDNGFTWEKCGYRGMLEERQVELVVMNGVETRPVPVDGGVVYSSYPIAREVADCAFFFNVPLAKCHNLGVTTLSIKNLMGILTSPVRHLCSVQEIDKPLGDDLWRVTGSGLSLFEDRFYHKLCDLVAALRSLGMRRLCAVDGLIGRDGTAFNEGNNHLLGWTAIGENEVHVDAVATYLMGLDPAATPYLKFAAERGLGRNRIEEIEVVDLGTGTALDARELEARRALRPLMPLSRLGEGYYARFRQDGSVVPWRIDQVNEQRARDGLEPIPSE